MADVEVMEFVDEIEGGLRYAAPMRCGRCARGFAPTCPCNPTCRTREDNHHAALQAVSRLRAHLARRGDEPVGERARPRDISDDLSGEHLCPTCALSCRALAHARLRKGVEDIYFRLTRMLAQPDARPEGRRDE